MSIENSRKHSLDIFAEPRLLSRKGPWPVNDEGVARLFVVDEGLVEQYRVIGQRKQIVALHYPSDGIVHWYPGMRLRGTVTSRLRLADDDDVQNLALRNTKFALLLRSAAQRQFEIASEWLHVLASFESDQKMAHFLCEHAWRLAVDTEVGEAFALPKQQDLADALSVTSVHVNRVLGRFDRDRLIERRASQTKIIDWKGLVRLGSFCGAYLRRYTGLD